MKYYFCSMNAEVNTKIENILSKAKDLASKYNALKISYEAAKDETFLLKNELQNQININQQLHNQIKITKLALNIRKEEGDKLENAELKSKIQDFVKEIDKCIALLNQ